MSKRHRHDEGPGASGVAPRVPQERRGRVLVVDDEPLMRATLERILGAHEVVTVRSGREALGRLVDGHGFDLILCDLMMPEMSGMELHAELSRRSPDAARRFVFLTGGVFTPSARQFAEQAGNTVLHKPFDPVALRKLVAQRIAERDRPPAPGERPSP